MTKTNKHKPLSANDIFPDGEFMGVKVGYIAEWFPRYIERHKEYRVSERVKKVIKQQTME